ncbi:MAG: RHS repeat-associated core domain-containing protein, partial [Thermoanaerobaculia bacterium]
AGTSAHRFFVYTPELSLLAGTRDDAANVWGGNPPTALGKNIDYEIVWFGDRPVAQVTPGFAPSFTFADHLGTPFLQTDSSRTVTWRVEYEPFGNVYEVRAGTRTDQPLRFPGQELATTWEGPEENYNIFRWYGTVWGRYTQADPLSFSQNVGFLYAYSASNPIIRIDRSGLFDTTDIIPAPGRTTTVCEGPAALPLDRSYWANPGTTMPPQLRGGA